MRKNDIVCQIVGFCLLLACSDAGTVKHGAGGDLDSYPDGYQTDGAGDSGSLDGVPGPDDRGTPDGAVDQDSGTVDLDGTLPDGKDDAEVQADLDGGELETVCTPDCENRQCGPDGCQGSCGSCPGKGVCTSSGTCECTPECEGKECGDDSCGGLCGVCDPHFACENGGCVLQPWCGDGTCDTTVGEDCETCLQDCPCGCGESCNEGECTFTACSDKACGEDGCGGICGQCPTGSDCTQSGQCLGPLGMEWKPIPGGTFKMGATICDLGGSLPPDDAAQHTVTLKPFLMLETEVTVAQYLSLMGSDPSCAYSGETGPDYPVECMEWDQAASFCQAVGGRLPTEAEWEYAARANKKEPPCCQTEECWDPLAWYRDNSGNHKHIVKTKTANAFGLYDMIGNVEEFCSDYYSEDYYLESPAENPWGPATGATRVTRGGSYFSHIMELSYSNRGDFAHISGNSRVGFRCVAWQSPCVADCTGKECGPDGCGGWCGDCPLDKPCEVATGLCDTSNALVWKPVAGGEFTMGCSPGDLLCQAWELPSHAVTLTPFEILETEVTEQQYSNVTWKPVPCAEGGADGMAVPVGCVRASEAKSFCTLVGGRLPTEAEWEYAARGGTTTAFYCGDDSVCMDEAAWYLANSDNKRHAVKQKQPNPFGLYDMLGNVSELCSDWYSETYYASSPVTDPQGPDPAPGDSLYVVRGGSYDFSTVFLRVSARSGSSPNSTPKNRGFRCVRAAQVPAPAP